jgi:hypothetical protein
MEKNKKSRSLKELYQQKDENNKLSSGGLVEEWLNRSYKKGVFYINHSGLVCQLPDDIDLLEEIREEYLEDFDGRYLIRV